MKLIVVMVDTFRNEMAIVHENSYMPYRKRHVEINLNPEQEKLLSPRVVGVSKGEDRYEEIGEVWLEVDE